MLMASGVEGLVTSPPDSRQRISILSNQKILALDSNLSQKVAKPGCSSSSISPSKKYVSKSRCQLNCDSSDEGNENVEYCEEDEAKLNPEDHNLSMEEHHSLPYIDCVTNTDTLFNLTATSPQKSTRNPQQSSLEMNEQEASDGVVNLSPFKSQLASKERAHRLITNIFELELDSLRQAKASSKPDSGRNLRTRKSAASSAERLYFGRKKFSIKELAYSYKKAERNVVRQLSTANKELTSKVSRTLQQAS